MSADERAVRAAALGHRLARLLKALDPDPTDGFLDVYLQTPSGAFRWDLTVSEAGVEQLTRLLEAVEEQQWAAQSGARPSLRLVREAS